MRLKAIRKLTTQWSLESSALFPYVACASPDYLSKHGMPKKAEELRQRPCLVHLNAKRNPNLWEFVEDRSSSVVLVNSRYRSSSVSAVLAAAVEGLGIGG